MGLGKTATGLGPGIRFESGGELKAASLLTGAWSCGVKTSHRGGSSPPGEKGCDMTM